MISPVLVRMKADAESDPEHFWSKEADKLYWFQKWEKVFHGENSNFEWFPGGKTNICYNCLDRHVENGRGGHAALISESELGDRQALTYYQLLSKVKEISSALRAIGVRRGDRIAIYMPTIPEAISLMLACARIGAIHIVIFAGFGPHALAERIVLSGAQVLFTSASTTRRGKRVPLLNIASDALREPSVKVHRLVVLDKSEEMRNRELSRDILSWEDFLEEGKGNPPDFEEMNSSDPLFILATSGTTAKPKLAVHVHGGYQVWIRSTGEWVFGLKDSDIWWSTSDIGWIVGHSFIVYAPLLFGATTISYEGVLDHPNASTFYRVIDENGVSGVFTSPTAIRLLMRYGTAPSEDFDLSSLKRIFSAGEVLNPPAWKWFQSELFRDKVPVIDHMWQTETGGPLIANPYGVNLLPIKPGSAGIALPGITFGIRHEDGRECRPKEKGIVVITKPFPGLIPTLWGDPERYVRDYWEKIPGVYFTGDGGYVDDDGYLWFSGRADEIIKIADHRIGTIEVESAFLVNPAVAEAGVTGRPDELRGSVISAFISLKSGYMPSEKLLSELLETVRHELGPLAVVGEINFVKMLPKTRSGKIMRRVLKSVILNKDPGDISTIEDEGSVEEARQAWHEMMAQMSRPTA